MAEFPCFSISMEAAAATTTTAASLLGLSSSSRIFFFPLLPRQSVRVSNLRRRKQLRNLLLSRPNSDLELISSNEWPDGSIIFHFGPRREIARDGVETEKRASTSASDEVASTEAILAEEAFGKDHQEQILIEETRDTLVEKVETKRLVDGADDHGATGPVHDNHYKSKELLHDRDLDVKSNTVGSAAALVTSAYSKAAVGPDLYGSPPNDMVNQGNDVISESHFDASALVPDLGSPPLDKKANEGKNMVNKIQVDASGVILSSDGAQFDRTTSEVDNIVDQSQVDAKKEEDNAINEAEFATASMVSNLEGSQCDATLNEQNSVIDEAKINTSIPFSSINDFQLDESIEKESNAISGVQFDASNAASSSGGSQLDGNVTDESSTISEVQYDTSAVGSSSDGSQLDDPADEKNGAFGEAQFHTTTDDASSNVSQLDSTANKENKISGEAEFQTTTNDASSNVLQLDITTNKENNVIGEAQLGTSAGASKVRGPQLGHTTIEDDVSVMETEVVTPGTVSNTDGSQLDDKVNQETTVFNNAGQSNSSPILSKPGVTSDTKNFIEEKSEIKTLVEDISSVSLDPAISSHPIDKSKEENVQMDDTDRPIGAPDSKHNLENLTGDNSNVLLASTSSEVRPPLMESASHDTTSTAAEEGLTERSLEEAGVRDEVHNSNSAETSQASIGESGYAETDNNREEVLTTEFRLSSGVASLPHPSKALTGGEDAYFIAHKWLGIADGACQWSMEGVKAGLYAQELVENSKEIISTSKSMNDPTDLIVRSTARTVTPGLSTVLVAHFNGQALHVANIGDTGFMVIRNGIILKRSAPMVHEFNFPVQIEAGDDILEITECYKTELDEGDIIVFATDGMFDNLYEQEITSIIQKSLQEGLKPQDIAKILATRANEVGSSASARSPFADAARAAGYVGYVGGKLDDVTVIVSLLERKSNFPTWGLNV